MQNFESGSSSPLELQAETGERSSQTGAHYQLARYLRHARAAALSLAVLLGEAEDVASASVKLPVAARVSAVEQNEQKPPPANLRTIREVVERGTEEQAFVCNNIRLNECYPLGSSDGPRLLIDPADIMAIAESRGWQELVLVHTHNMHDYGFTGVAGIVESYTQNGVLRESLPPSCIDLIAHNTLFTRLKANNFNLVEAVAGTTGVWEYAVRPGVWQKAMHSYNLALTDVAELRRNTSDPEADAVYEVLDEQTNVLAYVKALEKLSATNTFAQRVRSMLLGNSKPGQDFESLVREFEWRQLALGVLRADSDPKVLRAARQSFIEYARSLGVDMNFTPYPPEKR